jgi:hypothetical protein
VKQSNHSRVQFLIRSSVSVSSGFNGFPTAHCLVGYLRHLVFMGRLHIIVYKSSGKATDASLGGFLDDDHSCSRDLDTATERFLTVLHLAITRRCAATTSMLHDAKYRHSTCDVQSSSQSVYIATHTLFRDGAPATVQRIADTYAPTLNHHYRRVSSFESCYDRPSHAPLQKLQSSHFNFTSHLHQRLLLPELVLNIDVAESGAQR